VKLREGLIQKKRKASAMACSIATYVTAQGTRSLQVASHDLGRIPRKKQKISEHISNLQTKPTGLIWKADTLTCAYDSLLTILHSIHIEDPEKWADDFSDFNEHFHNLSQGWSGSSQKSLEEVRDDTQLSLSQKNPESFPVSNEYVCPL
jgi:hypothetical protein